MSIDERVVLQNEALRVAVIPGLGGRVESLQASAAEFLLQPYNLSGNLDPRDLLKPGLPFKDGACSGIDECLPTIAKCDGAATRLDAPDHGDYWNIPWRVAAPPTSTALTITADGTSRPLRLTKRLDLHPSSLRIGYELENLSEHEVSYLYACHPLLAIDPGDRIVLRREVTAARLGYSCDNRLGEPGDIVSWPVAHCDAQPLDLSWTLSPDAGTADMLYAGPLTTGRCGLYRSELQMGIEVRFNPLRLPYLGLWLCYGGWPEGETLRQVAVALEPTVSPRGLLDDAVRDSMAAVIAGYEKRSWSIEFRLHGLTSKISQEDFSTLING